MKTQIKVTDTRMHKISYPDNNDGLPQIVKMEIPVVEGKLVLLKGDSKSDPYGLIPNYYIISETEKIETGDWVLELATGAYWEIQIQPSTNLKKYAKILALPEQFSPKHLQAIVDGKMKDGDKVLVECEDLCDYEGEEPYDIIADYRIKLNSQGHVTLHKAEEKMYTKKEMIKAMNDYADHVYYHGMLSLPADEWFDINVK